MNKYNLSINGHTFEDLTTKQLAFAEFLFKTLDLSYKVTYDLKKFSKGKIKFLC